MKNLFYILITLAILAPASALAVKPEQANGQSKRSTDVTTGSKNWKNKLEEFKQAKDDQKLAKVQLLAQTLIENRITVLNNIKANIQDGTMAESEKTEILAEINKAIADLNTLKAEIKTQKDLTQAKKQIRTIFDQFKIYTVKAPKSIGLEMAAKGQYILGRLEALEAQLEKMINQRKNQGKDVTAIEALKKEFETKIADAKLQLEIAEAKFKSMTPANTEEAKAARTAGKEAMQKAKQDLKDAHGILKQIKKKLDSITSTTTTTEDKTTDTESDSDGDSNTNTNNTTTNTGTQTNTSSTTTN